MSTDGDRSELVVRAWLLSTGKAPDRPGELVGTRAIGAELGVSQSTAARYVREAAQAEGFMDLMDRAEVRQGMALRLAEYVTWLRAEMTQGTPASTVVPILLRVEERLAKLVGTDAPTRLQHENAPTQLQPDPGIVRALAEARTRNASERRAITGETDDRDTDDGPGPDGPG